MSSTDWLDFCLGAAYFGLALATTRIALADRRAAVGLFAVVAFCVFRAVDLFVVHTLDIDSAHLPRLLDILSLVTLIAVLAFTSRLHGVLTSSQSEAEAVQAEYGRALLEYTQLVRHRIANPLTAIIGGAQTIMDLDLDRDTQLQLLEAIVEKGKELENVALHPERISPEELSLHPTPAPLANPTRWAQMAREGQDIEDEFAQANRMLIERSDVGRRELSFVCECAETDCSTPVNMSLAEYFEVHSDGAHFVVAPQHNLPAIEDVVRKEADWWVVRKRHLHDIVAGQKHKLS